MIEVAVALHLCEPCRAPKDNTDLVNLMLIGAREAKQDVAT